MTTYHSSRISYLGHLLEVTKMILTKIVEVTISNNGKYYRNLGYGRCAQRDLIQVSIEDLPKNSNKIVFAKCDICGDVFERSYQMLNKVGPQHRCYKCGRNSASEKMIGNQHGFKKGCNTKEKHPRWNPHKDEQSKYYAEVTRYTNLNDLSSLENYDKPRGLCGVEGVYQLDHIIPIKYGFDNIDPKIIGNIKNLRFIPWEENRKKHMNISYKQIKEILGE